MANFSDDDTALLQAALADHAASLMRLYYTFERTRPQKAEAFRADAKRCLELSVELMGDANKVSG